MTINIEQLTKQFGSTEVFYQLNVQVEKVSSLILVGPSGGGKTTLLRILGGLEKPTQGRVVVNGKEIDYQESALRPYRKRMGFVFQHYNLFPHLTALENIVLPLVKVHGVNRAEAESQAIHLLRRFQLETQAYKKPHKLSGGQQQRVAICRAVSTKPEILFLDEPTSALDPEYTAEVLDVIREVHSQGIDTIVVTHEMGFARVASEEVLFVGYGGVLAQGSADEVFSGRASVRGAMGGGRGSETRGMIEGRGIGTCGIGEGHGSEAHKIQPPDPRVSQFFERVLKY